MIIAEAIPCCAVSNEPCIYNFDMGGQSQESLAYSSAGDEQQV